MLRLVIALLISVGYLVLLQAADPFKQLSTSFLALIANTTLVCSLVMALLLKSNEDMAALDVPDASQDGRSIFQKLFGFSPDTLVSLILCFNVLVVTLRLSSLHIWSLGTRPTRARCSGCVTLRAVRWSRYLSWMTTPTTSSSPICTHHCSPAAARCSPARRPAGCR